MLPLTRLMNIIQADLRVLLVSGPGLAKTSRLKLIAQMLGWDFIRTTPGIEERTDYSGCFVPDVKAQVTRVLPLETLKVLRETTRPTLWLLDDLGNAMMDVQAAIKGQLTEGGPFKDHPYVRIVAATNRPGDKTGVSALHSSLLTEFNVVFSIPTPELIDRAKQKAEEEKAAKENLKIDTGVYLSDWVHQGTICQTGCEVCGWVNWANDVKAPAEIVAWHRSTAGRELYQWRVHSDPAVRFADYRAWQTVINLWKKGLRDQLTISAAIGKPAAMEFLAYAQLAHKLPTPEDIWNDPEGAMVPDDPGALYLISSMLASAAEPKLAKPLVKYMVRLPRVYAALLGRDVHRKLGAAMSLQPAWQTWFEENEQLFSMGTGK